MMNIGLARQGWVAIGMIAAGCTGAPRPGTAVAVVDHHCLAVQVVDEAGMPVRGARVHSEAHSWAGPEGAFYNEGGRELKLRGEVVVTGADGRACVEDATFRLDAVRDDVERQANSASSTPYFGGFGPLRVGGLRRAEIHVVHADWPPATTNYVGLVAPETTTIRIGPPRSVVVNVQSLCDPATIRAHAYAGDHKVWAARHGTELRFEGLGPYRYEVELYTCDGLQEHFFLDAGSEVRRVEIETRATTPTAGPRGNATQVATSEQRGCVVTDRHELACFDRLYTRSDLSPPQMIPSWIDVGELGRVDVAKVGMSGSRACALRVDGEVDCWGYEYPSTVAAAVRIELPGPALDVEVGGGQACARLDTGAVTCWGWEDNPVPHEVPEFRDATALALAWRHTCVITPRGQVACAGANQYGQLGVGTHASDSFVTTPRVVPGIRDIVRIAATPGATYAWDASGRGFAWGTLAGSLRSPHELPPPVVVERDAADTTCTLNDSGEIMCREGVAAPLRPAAPLPLAFTR